MESRPDSGARERRAILWGAAILAGIALAGHLLFAGADVVWLAALILAVAAVPQAYLRRAQEVAERRKK
jgi:hypothetical protein